ncbi:MAG: hypothetical protein ACPGR8_11785 [Limisphaerales bacterium]
MDIKSAKALALWLFPEWATWGEAKPGSLHHPTDGNCTAWAKPPDSWGGDGAAGVQGAQTNNNKELQVAVADKADAGAHDE